MYNKMTLLYIYRNPSMGFSIGKVFKPIEKAMKSFVEVDAIYLPASDYSLIGLWKNINAVVKTLKKKKYSIVHITGGDNYLLPFLRKNTVVVTVHDLGFYTNHKTTIRGKWAFLTRILPLKMADKITFISDKSLQEAENLIHFRKGQCVIINNAIDPNFAYKAKNIDVKNPVILHIGTGANKNLIRSIEALKGVNCHLRIIGRLSENQIMQLKASKIVYSNVYNLSDEEMLKEYESCDIVNFPSCYEGFGMPIIEGQSIGRVIITSDIPPMNEIAGKGAVFVNPYNIKSMHEGYIEAMRNPVQYINSGLENVKRFALQDIVNHFYSLYCKVLENK